jgi:hypothetical protein
MVPYKITIHSCYEAEIEINLTPNQFSLLTHIVSEMVKNNTQDPDCQPIMTITEVTTND